MSQLSHLNQRLSRALRGAALFAADAALRQARSLYRSVRDRSGRLEGAAEQVGQRLRVAGERAIAKSPIPVPAIAHEALGRMHEALHSLEHVIESGDVTSLRTAADQRTGHRRGQIDLQAAEHASPASKRASKPGVRAAN